jgi:sulfate adenylyltransferase subunit 1
MVQEVRYKVDINTLHKIEDDKKIALNDIGRIKIRASAPVLFDTYRRNRLTGSFILVDDLSHNTVAAGMII